jgi:hypothetical protein
MRRLRLWPTNQQIHATRRCVGCLALVCIVAVSAGAQNAVYASKQEVRVANLPSLNSPSMKATAVLATELETIIQDSAVCCGKDSALEDAVLSCSASLKTLSEKLQGKHVLSDGLSVTVHAEYVPQSAVNAGLLVSTLKNQQPMLFDWKSRVYVLYGATFDVVSFEDGRMLYEVHKLFLLDLRYSDQRRETEFNKATDDWDKVQGVMTVSVERH